MKITKISPTYWPKGKSRDGGHPLRFFLVGTKVVEDAEEHVLNIDDEEGSRGKFLDVEV